MNKHLYRIIFNQRRGQLMVVGETAAAQGKQAAGTGGTVGATDGHAPGVMTAVVRPVALAVFGLLGMVLFVSGPAMGQVVADPRAPGSQRPTIVQSGNGVTQVNIQTPSAAGVSRNTYSQFDVQAGGAILNNSRGAVQTQTGGWVQANPWLAGGSARVILNEVNSANPSQLRGYVEVAGQRAEVVIANPAGMAIDGGGFINASRVVLTTGTPILNGGSLDGYTVQRGLVTIAGHGLDTSLTDYTAILARAVQINGGLWAKELNVVTGSNRLDAAHAVAAAEAGAGAAPTYALDVAQLGGMYAGKITLIGTEAGLGVRNAGTLAASAGNLVLQSNGWLSNSGTVYAGGDSRVGVQGSIANTGLIGAQGNLDATAGARIDSAAGAVIAAGLNTDNTLRTTGNLTLAAGDTVAVHGAVAAGGDSSVAAAHLDLAGAQLSGSNLALAVTAGDLDLAGAQVDARAGLRLDAAQAVRNARGQLTAQALTVHAQSLSNVDGRIVQLGAADLAIDLSGALDNTRGVIATNSDGLILHAASLSNVDGTIEHAGTGRFDLAAGALDLQRGAISTNGALALTGSNVDHRGARTVAGQLTVDAGTLDNRDGSLAQTGQGRTTVQAGALLDNRGGAIDTNGAAAIGAAEVRNEQGRLTAGQALALDTGALVNQNGTLAAGGALQVAAGPIDNTRGQIQSVTGDVQLTASTLDNAGGSVAAGRDVGITAQDVLNGGSLYAAGSLALLARGGFDNTGVVAARGDTRIDAGRIASAAGSLLGAGVNADGTLSDRGQLHVAATGAMAAHGQNLAGGDAVLRAASIDVAASQTAGANIVLDAQAGNVVTDRAQVTTAGTLTVSAGPSQALSNVGGALSAGQLMLTTGTLDNRSGAIVQTGSGDTVLRASTLDNTGGRLAVNSGNLTIGAGSFVNQGGSVEHAGAGTLAITADQFSGQQGRVTGNGVLDLQAGALDLRSAATTGQQVLLHAATLDHRGGQLQQTGTGQMRVDVDGLLDNTQGTMAGNGTLALHAAALSNQHGSVTAAAGEIAVKGSLDNRDGVLATAQALHVDSGALDNTRGVLQAGATLTLDAASLLNLQGTASAGSDVVARISGDIDNTRGQLQAVAGSATLDVNVLNNTAGAIFAGGDLHASTARVDNTGSVYADGGLSLHASGAVQNTGSLYAAGDLSLHAGDAVYNTGMLAALGAARIDALALDSSSGSLLGAGMQADGKLAATGDLTITTGQALAAHGQTLVAGAAALTGASVDLGGSWTSAGNLALTATHGDIGIDLARVSTAGALDINTPGALRNAGGLLYAGRDARIAVGGMLTNTGSLAAAGNNTITAGTVTSSGLLGAGMRSDGTLAAAGDLRIAASGVLQAGGQTLAAGSAWLAGAHIDLARGQVGADRLDITARSGDVLTNGAVVSARHLLAITANARNGQQLVNTNGRLEAGQLQLDVGNFVNTQGTVVQAGIGQTVITTALLDNTGGKIEGNGDALVHAQQVLNDAGRLAAGGDVTLVAGGFDNGKGNLSAGRHLAVTADTVGNAGSVYAGGNLALSASGAVTNTGVLAAQGDATLQAQHFKGSATSLAGAGILADGSLGAAGNLTIDTTDVLQAGGQTLAAGALALAGAAVDVSGGQVAADRIVLTARSADVTTTKALVSARTLLAITASAGNGQRLINTGGQLQAGQLQLTVANLDNRAGEIVQTGTGDTAIATGVLDNTAGRIAVNSANLALTANTLTNIDGKLEHAGSGAFTIDAGQLSDQRGRITANNALAIQTGAWDHRDAVTVASQVAIAAASLDNHGGSVAQTGAGRMTVDVTGVLDNTGGKIEGNGDALVTADQLRNNSGRIVAVHDTEVRAHAIANVEGTIGGGNHLDIIGATIDNTRGQLQAVAGHATLTVDRL
ncbi:MAG: filamentous hemagglutinin N-terminal domain-containing protein, partial [Duganella sp.]